MRATRQCVVYLHGFNSSPDSRKARLFVEYCHARGIADVLVPALPFDPALAMNMLERLVMESQIDIALLVGSSLGGYYATSLAERFGLKAALINPAVAPCEHLAGEFLGRHRNMYTHEEYDFIPAHVDYLSTLKVEQIRNPDQYLLLLQTGDEVLDYRLALRLYADCQQKIVQEGGSHGFDNFAEVLPSILRFAGLE